MGKSYTYNPPPKMSPSSKKNTSAPNTNEQIWNIFEPDIVLDEMSIKQESGDNNESKHKIEDGLSIEFPFILINGYIIGDREIISMDIDSTKKLPEIHLSLEFADEQFFTKYMPKDGDIISIMIRSKTGLLKPIRNDYVITGVLPGKRNTNDISKVTLTLFGELFVPGFDSYLGSKSYKGTSISVFKQIAKELELGFNTNENETDDYQVWYKVNSPREFLNKVIKNAYKDEDSFFDWWIDIYYNLNFVNVQKQLLRKEDEIDEAAIIHNVNTEYTFKNDEDETVATVKVFSNFDQYRNTSFYITSWKPINRSSKLTFDYGTSLNSTFFEHNQNLYNDPNSTLYWKLNIPPAYDPDKVEDHILLRGRTTYDPNKQKDELAKANYNYNELYKKTIWEGIQYTNSDKDKPHNEWNGNHHKNFKRAEVQNLINKVELEKLNIEINVTGTNLNIIKGDKVPIALIKKDIIEAKLVDEFTDNPNILDRFYSGWFYIKGLKIKYKIISDSIYNSNFSQTYILTRREWPAPEEIAEDKNNNKING